MRRLSTTVVAAVLAAVLATSTTSTATAAELSLPDPADLPAGCAVVLAPRGGGLDEAECLRSSQGPRTRGGSSDYVVVTEHGPWGSHAQRQGWKLYFVEPGLYYMPKRFNDEASAWGSRGFCGYFHVHAPGTKPAAFFPENRAGNFPYGKVGNDELSGVSVFDNCA